MSPDSPAQASRLALDWYCNGCGMPLLLPERGYWTCPGCEGPIVVKRSAEGSEVHGATPLAAGAGQVTLNAACATHSGQAAAGVCERCGDFRCAACTRVIEGRLYCAPCVPLLKRSPTSGWTRLR